MKYEFVPLDAAGTFAQVGFSVPKSKFKKATHRNLLKRRMREAYRLNKHFFTNWLKENNLTIAIFFMYQNSQIATYQNIEADILKLLHKLTQHNVSNK